MSAAHEDIERRLVTGASGELAVRMQGDVHAPAVLMTHSILSSSAMWDSQAALLADRGYRVVRIDAPGHGDSPAPVRPLTMDDLADDSAAALNGLGIERAHYLGLSLGGMSGFGFALRHPQRIASLMLCDARADAPPPVALPWDERIAIARSAGSCAPLARPTIERWFGSAFVAAKPAIANRLIEIASRTRVAGFEACARALQGLDYLSRVAEIAAPTTLLVGATDGVLPEAMRDLQQRIRGAELVSISDAGHLPNIDQPSSFDEALLNHLARVTR